MSITPGQPNPDWYPDPANPAGERWWSGQGWTDHVREAPPQFSAAAVPMYDTVQPYAPASPYAAASPYASAMPQAPAVPAATDAYVPMGGRANGGMEPYGFSPGLSLRTASPNTAPAWLLAFSLPLNGFVGGAVQPFTDSVVPVLAFNLIWWGLLILAILWDRSLLAQRGLPTASWLWFFLTVLGYLIARSVALSRVGVRNNSPWIVFCLLIVLGFGSALAVFLLLAARAG